jgi:nucleotide-binding universal stress UspA family protein
MRSILVYADRTPSMTVRLDSALSLARMRDSHLTLLVDTPVGRYVSMDALGGSFVATDALNQALADDDSRAKELDERLARMDVPFDVVRSEEEPLDALTNASRLADLVVISRSCALAGDLAVATRTPVLVLSDEHELTFPLEHACIAWDGSAECALAMRSAVPLLASAASVTLLTITPKPAGFDAVDALSYLSRHGISANQQDFGRGPSIEETLARAVGACGGQLLVMGAYGHSRMRDFLFGGVNRYFLEDAVGPALFIAH